MQTLKKEYNGQGESSVQIEKVSMDETGDISENLRLKNPRKEQRRVLLNEPRDGALSIGSLQKIKWRA